MESLYRQDKFQQAAAVVMVALQHIHRPVDRSRILSMVAYGYIRHGQL